MDDIELISNERKKTVFRLEYGNNKCIREIIKNKAPLRKNKRDCWTTSEYFFNNYTVYELSNENDLKNSTVIVTCNNLQGLTWKDLFNIQEDNIEFNTNIEQGAWITYYKNKIRYTVTDNQEIIALVQIEKKENQIITILSKAKTEELENSINNNLANQILLIDTLKKVTYDYKEISNFLESLNKYCINISKEEIEKQLLLIEKKELQENVDILTKRINNINEQNEELTKYANITEEKNKKTIDEIERVKNENEKLKNSIVNVRKLITKKCAYIPILGRLIIKDLNREFGENALPGGK